MKRRELDKYKSDIQKTELLITMAAYNATRGVEDSKVNLEMLYKKLAKQKEQLRIMEDEEIEQDVFDKLLSN